MCRLTKKTINYVLLQSVNRNEKQATCIKINQVWLKKFQVTLNDCAMVAFFNTIHDFWLSMTLILFLSEKFADQNHNTGSLTYAIWIVRLFPQTKNRITPFKVQFYNSFFSIWKICRSESKHRVVGLCELQSYEEIVHQSKIQKIKIHLFLKQCFSQSSLDTIWEVLLP